MSFTDLMSSSRGPGVVGMLMALFVLLGFGLLFVFAFDEKFQGGDQSIESVISHQEKEIHDTRESISRGVETLGKSPGLMANQSRLSELVRENGYAGENIKGLEQSLVAANKALAQLSGEFESYKDEYRALVRGRAKGLEMERLVIKGGEVFENVVIREVTAVGIQIRHDGGMRRITFEDLSSEMREQFHFDPKEKADAVAREAAVRGRHEAAAIDHARASAQQRKELKEKELNHERDRTARAIAEKEAKIKSLGEAIRRLDMEIQKESQKGVSRAPQLREARGAKQRELSALQVQVSRLRSSLN